MPSVTATASPPELTPRRRELLEAALHVVADEGLRGLTHRAVDRRAGLPEGTCSAYFRTRQALQLAVTEYVAATLAADVDALAAELVECTGDEDRAVALTLALFERWLDERELILGEARPVAGGPAQPRGRGGAGRLADPAGGRRGRSHVPAARRTATRRPRRSWRRSTGC